MILPLLADHVLREANHYLRLLGGGAPKDRAEENAFDASAVFPAKETCGIFNVTGSYAKEKTELMEKRNNLILITGLPAAGKSRFTAYAAERLGYPVLEKDAYKELLFDDIGFRSRQEKEHLGTAAMDIMYKVAGQFLDNGSSVILDNNFESASLPGLKRLTEEHHCHLVTVRFEGAVEAIYERFVKRDQDPNRHRGHIVNTQYPETGEPQPYVPISCEAFEKKFRERGMMDFYPGGALITVDVTTFEGFSNEALFARLKEKLV